MFLLPMTVGFMLLLGISIGVFLVAAILGFMIDKFYHTYHGNLPGKMRDFIVILVALALIIGAIALIL